MAAILNFFSPKVFSLCGGGGGGGYGVNRYKGTSSYLEILIYLLCSKIEIQKMMPCGVWKLLSSYCFNAFLCWVKVQLKHFSYIV